MLDETKKQNRGFLIKSGQIAIYKSAGTQNLISEWVHKLDEMYQSDPRILRIAEKLTQLFSQIPVNQELLIGYQAAGQLVGLETLFSTCGVSFFTAKVVSSELEFYEFTNAIVDNLRYYKMMDVLLNNLFNVIEYRHEYLTKRLNLFFQGGTSGSSAKFVHYSCSPALKKTLERELAQAEPQVVKETTVKLSKSKPAFMKYDRSNDIALLKHLRKIQSDSADNFEFDFNVDDLNTRTSVWGPRDMALLYKREEKRNPELKIITAKEVISAIAKGTKSVHSSPMIPSSKFPNVSYSTLPKSSYPPKTFGTYMSSNFKQMQDWGAAPKGPSPFSFAFKPRRISEEAPEIPPQSYAEEASKSVLPTRQRTHSLPKHFHKMFEKHAKEDSDDTPPPLPHKPSTFLSKAKLEPAEKIAVAQSYQKLNISAISNNSLNNSRQISKSQYLSNAQKVAESHQSAEEGETAVPPMKARLQLSVKRNKGDKGDSRVLRDSRESKSQSHVFVMRPNLMASQPVQPAKSRIQTTANLIQLRFDPSVQAPPSHELSLAIPHKRRKKFML